jgi:hypothetical protein
MLQPRTLLEPRRAARPRSRLLTAVVLLALALPGCETLFGMPAPARDCQPSSDQAIYRSAGQEQVAHLERQVARLRADLLQAEEAMVAIESGLRGAHTRADAVSSVAEARIAVERATPAARWRPEQVSEARAKLEEAERQLQAGHTGSAVFFASRARRIAQNLNEEAEQVTRHASTRFVNTRNVNLRAGPSTQHPIVDVLGQDEPVFPEREQGDWVLVRTLAGPAGWIHVSLLSPR